MLESNFIELHTMSGSIYRIRPNGSVLEGPHRSMGYWLSTNNGPVQVGRPVRLSDYDNHDFDGHMAVETTPLVHIVANRNSNREEVQALKKVNHLWEPCEPVNDMVNFFEYLAGHVKDQVNPVAKNLRR